ncbi:MAG: ferritin-like domain-containing protein [Wolbachia sp.]
MKLTKDTIRKILEDNLKLEKGDLKNYRKAISITQKERDFVNIILLEELLKNEEKHYRLD